MAAVAEGEGCDSLSPPRRAQPGSCHRVRQKMQILIWLARDFGEDRDAGVFGVLCFPWSSPQGVAEQLEAVVYTG